jgi:hypothetical protein
MSRRLGLAAALLALLASACSRDLDVPSLERVVLSPAFSTVAPRQTVSFTASGGAGGYAFGFAPGGRLSGTDATIDSSGLYVAGSAGSAQDTVEVTDAAGRKATAKVQVGTRLQIYRSETRAVAPRETVAFLAIGGQPPYTFSIAASGSGNPTVDPVSGAYVAGDRAGDLDPDSIVTDVVRVTDASGVAQSATMEVLVGKRLHLRLDTSEVFPGVAARLVADGGKPPYAFAFADRGNRSRGTVNAFSGEYVPGFSPGAIDVLAVTDATSAPPAAVTAPAVGGVPLAVGAGAHRCIAGDFNGDLSADVAFGINAEDVGKFVVAEMLDTPAPFIQGYYMAERDQGWSFGFAGDFSGTGRERILFFGGGGGGPGSLWSMVPDLAGYMSIEQPTATAGTQPGNVRMATAVLDPEGATTFYIDASGPGCWVPSPGHYLVRVVWPRGALQPSAPTCVLAEDFCPASTCGSDGYPVAMAAGDFNGDGKTDLAWILQTSNDGSTVEGPNARVYVSYGDDIVGPGQTTLFPALGQKAGWPAGSWSFQARSGDAQTAFMAVPLPSGGDALLVRLTDATTGRSQLFAIRDPQAAGAWDAPFDPNGAGVAGVAAYVPAPGAQTSFVAWSGHDGIVTGFTIDPSTLAFTGVSTIATVPFAVNAVCMPDVNADLTPDLVAAGEWSPSAQLLLGDGTLGAERNGTFAMRAHLRGATFPVAVGDLDGDGLGDAVVAGAEGGLHVLWGGGGMLAWGPQVSSASIGAATVADFTGEGRPSIVYQEKSGRFARVRSGGDGTFDPSVVLTGFAAAGGAPGAYFFVWPGDLGTSAAGVDLLTSEFGDAAAAHALLLQDRGVVDVRAKPFPAFGGDYSRVQDCWHLALPPSGAAGFVAAICSYRNQSGSGSDESRPVVTAVWGAMISRPDGEPGTAERPEFSDWVLLTSTTTDNPFTRATAGGGAAFAGNVTPPGGARPAALFLMETDRLYAVEVTHPGTGVAQADWTVNAIAVEPDTHVRPFLATAGPMVPGYAYGVVTSGGDGTVVLRRTSDVPGRYELVQQLSPHAFPLGIAPLSTPSLGDVVTFNGDFSNTGLVPEIIPLLNDGTGKVR